jgi:hypothetical protein
LERELEKLMAAAWLRESGESDGGLESAKWLYAGSGKFLDLQRHVREAVVLLTAAV